MRNGLYISWRYLVTKRKEKFLFLISFISVSGVAIGVMALIIVIGVMSGFDQDLREKIIGNYSHITLVPQAGLSLGEYEKIKAVVRKNPHVVGMSPYVQGQILLKEDKKFFAVSLKGIDPQTEKQATKLDQYVSVGSIDDLADGTIILGKELAAYLGVFVGSPLIVYSPLGKQYEFTVKGIFSSGMYDYDMNLAVMNLATAQKVLGIADQISSVAIKLDNVYLAEKVREQLLSGLQFKYYLKTWTEANRNFFAALKLEKITMFIILTLIILVASFNIISTLTVTVVEKTKDIGILRAIGMTSAGIRNIFAWQGLLIGGFGTIFGACGGIGVCALLKKYQFVKLPQDIYYIDHLPVSIELWPDITLIALASFVIVLVSTIYPAVKASHLKPVEALRYE